MQEDARLLIDRIFDLAQGWPYSIEEVPLRRDTSPDGQDCYIVELDGTGIVVLQRTYALEGYTDEFGPDRLVVRGTLTGAEITDGMVWLRANYDSDHFPELSLDDENNICIAASLPVHQDFPLEWARRQLMATIGMVARTVDEMHEAMQESANGEDGSARNMAGKFIDQLT